MKMVSLIDGIFWGVLLIVVGVWFLVRRYVPVHIPVVRVIIAVLFVYIGVRVLVRGPVVHDRNTVVFSDSTVLHYTPHAAFPLAAVHEQPISFKKVPRPTNIHPSAALCVDCFE